MAERSYTPLDDGVYAHLCAATVHEGDILAALRQDTVGRYPDWAQMLISPDQAQVLAWLVATLWARRYLEVGTFTGYSALAVLIAMGPAGWAECLDRDPETTALAQSYWARAGVANRARLRLGEAADRLAELAAESPEPFDLALIDADKTGYAGYYEQILPLMRPGGVILADNVLWHGQVGARTPPDSDTAAIQAFNRKVGADPRVTAAILPVGDGVLAATKR